LGSRRRITVAGTSIGIRPDVAGAGTIGALDGPVTLPVSGRRAGSFALGGLRPL
jgi:hypothetical protein